MKRFNVADNVYFSVYYCVLRYAQEGFYSPAFRLVEDNVKRSVRDNVAIEIELNP